MSSPRIHIFAGLKVCIQAMTPTTASFALASRNSRLIASLSVSTGFQTMVTGMSADAPRAAAMLLRLARHLLERLGAVETLAAGEEPDLVCREVGDDRAAVMGFLSSRAVIAGAHDGEAGAVTVEVGGEPGDVVGIGVGGGERSVEAKTRSSR